VSTIATVPTGDFLTFDKPANRITFYRTNLVSGQKGSSLIDALRRYSSDGAVDIQVIYFVPWHIASMKGVRIAEPSIKKGGAKVPLSDAEVRRRIYGEDGKGKYDSYIVRCRIHGPGGAQL
jgi:hypothetical protein